MCDPASATLEEPLTMAQDRFISFKDKVPTHDELVKVANDYGGGVGIIQQMKGGFIIKLPGRPSSPFRRVSDIGKHLDRMSELTKERWIEVFTASLQKEDDSAPCVDVITRQMDDWTNSLAEGLAVCIARFWKGERW